MKQFHWLIIGLLLGLVLAGRVFTADSEAQERWFTGVGDERNTLRFAASPTATLTYKVYLPLAPDVACEFTLPPGGGANSLGCGSRPSPIWPGDGRPFAEYVFVPVNVTPNAPAYTPNLEAVVNPRPISRHTEAQQAR